MELAEKVSKSCALTDKFDDVIDRYGAQLGEIAWHTFTIDPSIEQVSRNHYEELKPLLKKYKTKKFLEIACYAHYTGHLIHETGIDATLCDISPYSLTNGKKACLEAGHPANARLVASDFHDLPFEDESFDFVFIASAVHHTITPSVVLNECLRVLSKKGILYLYNEPCQRAFSFYKFRTNRRPDFSDFEKYIDEKGLLRLVTSFMFQGRPEELFGMVENDRIPLSTYTDVCQFGEVKDMALAWQAHLSDLDQEILDAKLSEKELAELIKTEINARLQDGEISKREKMMGMCKPTSAEIENLSSSIAHAILSAPKNGIERDIAMTDIFGGAIKLLLKKKVNNPDSESIDKSALTLPIDNGVHVKPLLGDGYIINIDTPLLPNIQTADEKLLRNFYPEKDWVLEQAETGNKALIANSKNPHLNLVDIECAVLVIRMFTPFPGEPYKIQLHCGDELINELTVANSESRIIKQVLSDSASTFSFSFTDLDGNPLEARRNIRLPVIQLIPIVAN